MPSPPIVLLPLSLPSLLHQVLAQSHTAPILLIICSSREAFLQDLLQSLEQDQSQEQDSNGSLQDLVTPSLHNLFTTRHIKLAFCSSVPALLAFLTAYGRDDDTHIVDSQHKTRLVLVNPLALHAPTPYFSAQGLSRAFAAATETTLRTNTPLQVIECHASKTKDRSEDDQSSDIDMSNGDEDDHPEGESEEKDPWDQEVSILNVSARRYGSNSGERAWAGRTLTAKSIASRWFRFEQQDDHETREGLG
jgi:hypothetical protein